MKPRTPLTYFGGKQRVTDQIVAHMPPHRIYLEPFAGGAAVLFAKPRAPRETINDLDGAIAAFWRVLRERPDELAAAVELTPYSRDEWQACAADRDEGDDLERARRVLVTYDQSYARVGCTWSPPSLGFDRIGRWQPGTWSDMPERIVLAATRLKGVAIENTDAIPMVGRWDLDETLIYCDPPYTGEHRLDVRRSRGYRHDDTEDLWPSLVAALLSIEKASVLLSGYPCEATEDLESAGWRRLPIKAWRRRQAKANRSIDRTPETLWLNPAATAAPSLLSLETAA